MVKTKKKKRCSSIGTRGKEGLSGNKGEVSERGVKGEGCLGQGGGVNRSLQTVNGK